MKLKRWTPLILAGAVATLGACSPSQETDTEIASSKLEGDWSGVLEEDEIQLGLVLHIARDASGLLAATLDSPDQGMSGIPVSALSQQGNGLKLEVKDALLTYEGSLSENGETLTGILTQNREAFPLTLERGKELQRPLTRPQEPKPPFPYDTEEVCYTNPKTDWTLAGTLTLPQGEGPHPVALLITGSGQHDRDETLLGHKPFFVLADHLTRQGIAVLRVDDRGVGKSTGIHDGNTTTADLATDVLAGVAYLKSRSEINPHQIGLIGHSEGGLIAPMVAIKSQDVAFIVLMGGPGVCGEEILYQQAALIQRAEGVDEELIQDNLTLQREMLTIVKEESSPEAAEQQLREALTRHVGALSDAQREELAGHLQQAEQQLTRLNSGWTRYFISHQPEPVLQQVRVPVLAITGERDLQVSARQNLPVIMKALENGGNADHTTLELPELNHLFQTCETGSPSEYVKIEQTIAPVALNSISDWILKHTSTCSRGVALSLGSAGCKDLSLREELIAIAMGDDCKLGDL